MQNSQYTQPAWRPTLCLLPCFPERETSRTGSQRSTQFTSVIFHDLDRQATLRGTCALRRGGWRQAQALPGGWSRHTPWDGRGRGRQPGYGKRRLHRGPVLKHPEEPPGAAQWERTRGRRRARRGSAVGGSSAAAAAGALGPARAGGARKAPRSLPAAEWRRRVTCARPGRAAADGTARGAARHVPPDRYPRYPCGFPSPALTGCLPSPPRCPPAPHDSRDPFPPPALPCPPGAQRLSLRVGSGRGQAAVVAV